jgi:hypothetical protein
MIMMNENLDIVVSSEDCKHSHHDEDTATNHSEWLDINHIHTRDVFVISSRVTDIIRINDK